MAKIVQDAKVAVTAHFICDEEELRGLDALVGYGWDGFISTFKKHMGESYVRGHEDGLKRFFESVRQFVPAILYRTDSAAAVFRGEKEANWKGCADAASTRQAELTRLQHSITENFPESGEGDPVGTAISLLTKFKNAV